MTGRSADERPRFLVTVDAEGDDLWSRPAAVTTENARFLPRFQRLCEHHGVRPTYLATYEMAECASFHELGRQVLRDDSGEIGMHLHAWNSPPLAPLTECDHWHQPYATQYPADVLASKIATLTERLQDVFGVAIRSHRAGRWAFDAAYARTLVEHGYHVDSSVTPHVSWRRLDAGSFEREGPDYTGFPETPYFLDPQDIRHAGTSSLLEVPMTTFRVPLDGARRDLPGEEQPFVVRWLRPNGRNLAALQGVVRQALETRPCLVLMLHSSELMPGGSAALRHAEDVEALYAHLESVLASLSAAARSVTLSELYDEYAGARAAHGTFGRSDPWSA